MRQFWYVTHQRGQNVSQMRLRTANFDSQNVAIWKHYFHFIIDQIDSTVSYFVF